MVPPSSGRVSRAPPYSRTNRFLPVRACHPLWGSFPAPSGSSRMGHWPGPRSLATTSGVRLMSFPPATEMFQFAGFASPAYGLAEEPHRSGGLPHSEIPGSTSCSPLPGAFAACHVLHRLSTPRHPPDALAFLHSSHRPPHRPSRKARITIPALAGRTKKAPKRTTEIQNLLVEMRGKSIPMPTTRWLTLTEPHRHEGTRLALIL